MGRKIFFIGSAAVLVWFLWTSRTNGSRITVALSSDPVVIWSWEGTNDHSVLLSIPGSTVIDAVGGYGTYPVSSLWKLGELHQKDAELFSDSLSEALGVPVPWHVGELKENNNGDNAFRLMKETFSLKNFPPYLLRSYRTNISPFLWIKMIGASGRMSGRNSTEIILSPSSGLQKIELADGSVAHEINVQTLDALLGNAFENSRVRAEAIPLGVYNTTKTVALGVRMARTMTHLGGNVVLVANSIEPVGEKCRLTGKEVALKSFTAQFFARELGCTMRKNTEESIDERVDLGLFIGGKTP